MPRISSARTPSGRRRLALSSCLAVLALLLPVQGSGDAASAAVESASPWKLLLRDDFSGTALDTTRWGAYQGEARTGGLWLRSHVQVANGVLTLKGFKDPAVGGRWASGGIGNKRGVVQTYGKYRVRMRVDNAYGLSYAVLLYPQANVSPPEVDFAEGFGRSQQRTKATVHSGTPEARVRTGLTKTVDMTKWHTVAVEWTPHKLVFSIDNVGWFTVTGSKVPSVPMVLDIQSQIHDCTQVLWGCPRGRSVADEPLRRLGRGLRSPPGGLSRARLSPRPGGARPAARRRAAGSWRSSP